VGDSGTEVAELVEGEAALLLSEPAAGRLRLGDGSGGGLRTSGRGLVLVDTVADRWATVPTQRGKRVWFGLLVRPVA